MLKRLLPSFHLRLALAFACIFLLCALTVGAMLYMDARHSLETQMKTRIANESTLLLGDWRDDGLGELRHDIRERIESDAPNRLRYAVINAQGRAIFDRLPRLPKTPGWHATEHYLLLVSELEKDYRLIVGGETSAIRELEDALWHGLLIYFAATVLCATAGGWLVGRYFIRRVTPLSRMVQAVGEGQFSRRAPLNGTGDEFDRLSAHVNRMAERIEALVQDVRQTHLAIAHDLRTPLAKLRRELEAPAGDAVDAGRALALLEEAQAIFDAILRIAEIESGSRRKDFVSLDLRILLEELCDSYAAVSEHHGKRLSFSAPAPCLLAGDRRLLLQLFSNLIENALIHGGEEILISLDADAARVADNGNGIDDALREKMLKPFYRGDTSRHRRGHGLGLSMAASIATLHDMTLRLEDNGPGLRVSVYFPDGVKVASEDAAVARISSNNHDNGGTYPPARRAPRG